MGLRQWLNRFFGMKPSDPVDWVETTAEGFVMCVRQKTQTVPWERVQTIAVQHLAGAYDPAKTHYILSLPERDIRVACLTPGMRDFLERLQKVPGLRHRDYRDAMRFGNEFPVVIWTNPTLEACPEHTEQENNI